MQFVSWMLASFSSIDELVEQIDGIRVVGVDPRASTVHWRVTEPSGRQIVIEIMN
jgi:choloylglycine hydrolase